MPYPHGRISTSVTDDDARTLLTQFDLARAGFPQGITAGIENTNYFLTTTAGEYVLTVFEVLTREQLPFYVELMHLLAERGVPGAPSRRRGRDGARLVDMHGKPCAIVTRLPGGYEPAPGPLHCELTGRTLARAPTSQRATCRCASRIFAACPGGAKPRPRYGPSWTPRRKHCCGKPWTNRSPRRQVPRGSALPSGPAHCDLFRDNVLFAGTLESPLMGGFHRLLLRRLRHLALRRRGQHQRLVHRARNRPDRP